MDLPETPEGVALALLLLLLRMDEHANGGAVREHVFGLYRDCLAIVNGQERQRGH